MNNNSIKVDYKKINRKNIINNVLIYLSVFVLLLVITNYEISAFTKKQIYQNLLTTVKENSKTIAYWINDRIVDLDSYSLVNAKDIKQIEESESVFQALTAKEWYDFIFIADNEGNIVFSIDNNGIKNNLVGRNIRDRDYFKESFHGKSYISEIFYSDILKRNVLIISKPLKNKFNKTIGVIAASIRLNKFYDLLFDLNIGKTSELILINNVGVILSPTRLGGQPLVDKAYHKSIQNPHVGNSGLKIHLDYRGQKVLCAYQKSSVGNFYIASEMDLKEAMLPVNQVSKIILYVFAPFFLILIVLSKIYSATITSILKKLTSNLENALQNLKKQKIETDEINKELKQKIDEIEKISKELVLSEEYIRFIINSISFGIVSINLDYGITHYNKNLLSLFNIKEIRENQNIFDTIPYLNNSNVREALENIFNKKINYSFLKEKINRGVGDEFFTISIFAIINDKEEVVGATFLVENITEKEILQEQLAQYEKLSALSQLALGAAHEINNPLLGISSYLELKLEEAKDEKEKTEIKNVLDNVYRISTTIRGLLNFARPAVPQFTNMDVNKLIEEILYFLSLQPLFRKIEIKTILSDIPLITADINQIRQVLTNMFINAAQAMPNGGTLKVETAKIKYEDLIQIKISDTGVGIPPENINKLFEPFFTTKKGTGTGLGLSISLSYIKNHNGNILVDSTVNLGTTFTIILPVRQKGKIFLAEEEVIS
jgi:signal transduction histidine kinase